VISISKPSSWCPVASDVPQQSILVNNSFNSLENRSGSALSKFMYDIRGEEHFMCWRAEQQRRSDEGGEMGWQELKKFNKGKSKALHLG